MIPETPQTLLKKISEYAAGDDAAEWEKFVELYEPVIRLYITGRGDVSATDGDDIVQDIFVRLVDVLRNGEYKKEKGAFRSYLAAMVRRLLIDRYRRVMARGGDRATGSLDGDIVSEAPDPAVMVDIKLCAARHAAAVEHVLTRTMLDDKTVAAYREYALEERPAKEVATRYGFTLNALRQLKHRVNQMIDSIENRYT